MSDPTSQPPLRRPTPLQSPATHHRSSLFACFELPSYGTLKVAMLNSEIIYEPYGPREPIFFAKVVHK